MTTPLRIECAVQEQTAGTVRLRYGRTGTVDLAVDEARVRGVWLGPPACDDLPETLAAALDSPVEFPPVEQAVIPDDRVVLALDRDVPAAPEVVAAVWDRLAGRGVDPKNVLILQPADASTGAPADPRSALPAAVRDAIGWQVHEAKPHEQGDYQYLATTAGGERVHLAGPLLDADVVVSIGGIGFDPLLGYRGTHSVFYPGLSTGEAVRKSSGQAHGELGPDDHRPLRQLADEVGWLLGTPFTVQVLPAAGGGVSAVLAGSAEPVLRKGKELAAGGWTVRLPERVETVVVAVDDEPGRGWSRVAAALAVARKLVERDGKIVVLSQLADAPSGGIELLRRCESPDDAIRPLREASPPDLLAATQFAEAVDWARVYLLSRLDSDLVEELFCVPVESDAEVARLLASGVDDCVFVGSAQNADARIG